MTGVAATLVAAVGARYSHSSPMDAHAVEILELSRVMSEVGDLCRSTAGADLLRSQPIAVDEAGVDALLRPSVQLRALIAEQSVDVGLDLPEVSDALPITEKAGTALEPEAAARVGRFLRTSQSLARRTRELPSDDAGLLQELLVPVGEFPDEVAHIFRIVTDSGELRESDIPELAAIRRRIRRLQATVESAAGRYLSDPAFREVVNGDRATERDGRTVLPVHAKHRARVPGIVHEVSGSGATVFVEPQEIVDGNNRIVEEQFAYQREVLRIMRRLTGILHARQDELVATVAAVAHFDTIVARAEYARRHDCSPAERRGNTIALHAARHPLLGKDAVPIELVLSAGGGVEGPGGGRALIVTGPNTGGKTAALKTLGLLALMNQLGMEVPASPGSTLPVFDQILADIGDEQSLQQSLSTFSGHVRRQAAIAEAAGPRALVLLDELGAGTDPEEGSALAMALLDHLLASGARVVATTHHGALKNYGYLHDAVENAAVEFDLETLSPTYHILLGVPGESHALAIARRHGMPAALMDVAEGYLQGGRSDAGALMRTLTERETELHERVRAHERAAEELAQRMQDTAEQDARLNRRERELRDEGLKDLRQLLRDSRREVEGAVRAVREAGNALEPAAQGAAREVVARLEAEVVQVEQVVGDKAGRSAPRADLAVGSRVLVRATGVEGTVLRAGRRGTWTVAAGNVRGTFTAAELEVLPDESATASGRRPARAELELSADSGRAVLELNVRGMRLAEALSAVEKQLDRAVIAGLQQFSILHGKGEGVLRNGIQRYLADSESVGRVYSPPPQAGGEGKTVVEMR